MLRLAYAFFALFVFSAMAQAQSGFGNEGSGFSAAPSEDSQSTTDNASSESPPAADYETPLPADNDEQSETSDGEEKQETDLAPDIQSNAVLTTVSDDGTTSATPPTVPLPNEIGGNGSFDYDYPLALPSYRGLEPSLALNYNSSRKTKRAAMYQGWLGYGWGTKGFDVIERQRPNGGVAAFDENDVFIFNGMELVPCAADTNSPSCANGGTHATEIESYRRIQFNSSELIAAKINGSSPTAMARSRVLNQSARFPAQQPMPATTMRYTLPIIICGASPRQLMCMATALTTLIHAMCCPCACLKQ